MRVCVCEGANMRAWLLARALVHLGVGLGLGAWSVRGRGRVCGRAVLNLFWKCFFVVFWFPVFSFRF